MAKKNRYNLIQYNRLATDYTPPEPFTASYGILTVVDAEENPIPVNGYRDFYITHRKDGWDRLHFSIPVELPVYREITEETVIRYAENEYLVKKINNGNIDCEINLDFLKRSYYESFTATAATLSSLLNPILPTGWTAPGAISVRGTADIQFDYCTGADLLAELEKQFRVCFVWNHAQKTCTVVSAETAEDMGQYVTDELNLKDLSYRGSTTNFCTRLYCYGKNGATIDSVNDGKRYIEDYTYSSKLVIGYYKCDYEKPANILTAGQYELRQRSRPEQSYECDVVDLAKLSPNYSFLDFKLHNAVTLIDRKRGLKVKHRIVEYKEYPDEPERNVVTLAQAVKSMAQIKEVVKTAVDEVRLEVAEVNAAVAENVTAIQANINDINANVAAVNANVGTVVNDIATLNTKTASLSSRQDRTETVQASLTTTVASHGAAINGVVTWQATTYVNDRQETANSLAAINVTATSQGAQITALASWKDTTYVNDRQVVNEALAAINATANAQGATIESVTTWKSTTYVNDRREVTAALAAINQTVNSQGASIGAFTQWYEVTYPNDQKQLREAVTAIEQSVSAQGASITALAGYTTETVSTFTDALAQMNATANAQGAQITTLTTWVNETYVCDRRQTNESLAAINQTVNSQGAEINSLTTWKTTTYANDKETTQEALAAINQAVGSQGASITTLTEWKSSATTAIASAWNTANEAGAAAGYVVEKTTNGHKLKASIVIEAINNESTAHISADRINFEGFTTFVRPSDLQGGGSVTTINGGLITTETIDVGSIKKSTVTNGSRAVVFDVGIQTSYVRTNDITATGQLNLGATLVAVGSALTVNGKNVLVEGDVDLTGYATQTWSNNAFAVKDHTHAGYLNYSSANTTTLVVSKVGSTDHYNIALIGHGHSNYALSNHTHDGMATQEWVGSQGFATQNWANNAFAASDHTHAGLLNFKSANTTAIVFTSVGATTQYSAAAVGHGHSNYAASDHTHEGMATQSWANGAFASLGHTHAGTMTFKSANTNTVVLSAVGDTTQYNLATAAHTHSGYAPADHTHAGMFSFSATAGTNLTMARAGSTTTYVVALANHTHTDLVTTDLMKFSSTTGAELKLSRVGSTTSYTVALANHTHTGYATSDHNHTDYFKFNSTAGTNLNMAKIGTTTTYYNVALANHTHSGLISSADLSGHLSYSSVSGTTLVATSVGSTTKTNIALANHTHDFSTTDHMKFKSTSGVNITLTRLGATTNTDYTFSLANHTHTGYISTADLSKYISSSDLSGYLVYSSTSGSTLILTSGTTTKINVALANHTHDTDIVDHMLFGSTVGTNITLKRIGAYSNTNYTFALANHTHDTAEVNYTDLLKYKSTTGANITLTKIGAYSNTDYTFSLANHTHSGMEVNYANLLQVVNTNATTGVVNAKYVSYTTYGTSSTVSLSLALWSSNSGGGGSTVDFMKFSSTTGANITLTKIGSYSNTNYTFSLANHTHSSYVSTGDLNGKWYVNINGTKYYLRSP